MKLLAVASIVVLSALGADLDGTWTGSATTKSEGDTKATPMVLVLKKTGANGLEGTAQAGSEEPPRSISGGRVEGSKLFFEVKGEDAAGPVLLRFQLELAEGRLSGTYTREGSGKTVSGDLSFTKKT
ncbi:MAG TPA: hypothetical protein DEH78_31815 [Solibacterales bacterium]|nr:hypothetical protein [Bryobacterales bacterium]